MIKRVPILLLPLAILSACSTPYPQQVTRTATAPVSTSTPTPKTEAIPQEVPVTQPAPVVVPRQDTQQHYHSFEAWKQDFSNRLMASGFSAQDVNRLLASAQLNQRIISLDKQQPEFSKMPWEYADSATSSVRIKQGQQQFANQRNVLMQLEQQYGVPASIVTAIWGMESSYGQGTGSADLVSALATLAYEGRRRAFAEAQLRALLQLLQRGDVSWSHLKGSWAGGMGHTQFIPETWLKQGVDGDGDGRRNPWATADALSSTANYLSHSGWVRGLSPFYEVRLPSSFNYALASNKKSFAEWRALGISILGNAPTDMSAQAELWLPAGAQGPALLLSRNFEVIRVYNNSSSYALGVSLLAKGIIGSGGIQTAWPRHERPLSTAQARQLQQRLTALGFDTQGTDGVIGSNTRRAFQRWQEANGQVADGFISQRSTYGLLQ